jgi:SAM-dependent methyltransferase
MRSSSGVAELAPGVPVDYYRHLDDAERGHWWYRSMRALAADMLGDRMRSGLRVLDAGCGTGGFLRFLLDEGDFSGSAGVDVAAAAIERARTRVPEADLRVAALRELPFEDGVFDLVVLNDVLQHVADAEIAASLRELRRVLGDGGALLVRTNGARRFRSERADWRAYDRAALRGELEAGGFGVERITYVNCVPSLLAAVRGSAPRAPSADADGVPPVPSGLVSALGQRLAAAESWWVRRGGSLPYGHTLLAMAHPRGEGA